MKVLKKALLTLCMAFTLAPVFGQSYGMSFSYFFPKNGYFSNPVAPVSIRGLGFDLGKYFSIGTGITLYRISGMGITGTPFQPTTPIMGPHFSVMVPLELSFILPMGKTELELLGGGFVYYNFDNHINYGNLDRAIAVQEGWTVTNADFTFDNNIGLGYHYGGEFTVYVKRGIGISFKAIYYTGNSDLNLAGTYTGGTISGPLEQKTVYWGDTKLDFTGLELGLGVTISQRR